MLRFVAVPPEGIEKVGRGECQRVYGEGGERGRYWRGREHKCKKCRTLQVGEDSMKGSTIHALGCQAY